MPSIYPYQKVISNFYLGATKTIKALTQNDLYKLEHVQLAKWEVLEKSKKQKIYLNEQAEKVLVKDNKAKIIIKNNNCILLDSLNKTDKLNWCELKNNELYKKQSFVEKQPSLEFYKQRINIPNISWLEKIIKSKKIKRENLELQAECEYNKDLKKWDELKCENEETNRIKEKKFNEEKIAQNKAIQNRKNLYEKYEFEAVEYYFINVLQQLEYKEIVANDYLVQYKPNEKLLIISMSMPTKDNIQNIKGYKYIKNRDETIEQCMKPKEYAIYYNGIINQIILRIVKAIYSSDYANAVELMVVNGWISTIDKTNGQEFDVCIISLQISREKFENINLTLIDPIECVRALKGVVSDVVQYSPVNPIMNINKEDKRFIKNKKILSVLDFSKNLAEMDWVDFEHLVRELFAKYFAKEGEEVRVTQSSRDGGVDAIAFDPDPIKGGKFVIQAKRYNNIVPVSAVRDLYGTMLNEGAAKGILVTTSYYGKDSREFAKNKPITLIDGSNLVFMFNKYGYDVKIKLHKKN